MILELLEILDYWSSSAFLGDLPFPWSTLITLSLVLIHWLPMEEVDLQGDGIQIVQTNKAILKMMDLLSTWANRILWASFFQGSQIHFRSCLEGNISILCSRLPPPSPSAQKILRIS